MSIITRRETITVIAAMHELRGTRTCVLYLPEVYSYILALARVARYFVRI